jgi:hypothetical protein
MVRHFRGASRKRLVLEPIPGDVIRRTFLILPSIGGATERRLWREGVLDWDCFLDSGSIGGISKARKQSLDRHLSTAREFLERGETAYFSRLLPSREHWRLLRAAGDEIAYLDIETDGLGQGAVTTVVGVHKSGEDTTLVRGRDLSKESIARSLEGVKLIVTYNGSTFDLPMIEREFPFAVPKVPHFDLRHGCSRLGYTGGLKSVERQLGIARDKDLEYMTGEQAVWLWHAWERTGSENALRTLLRYNMEDVKNLVPIARIAYDGLVARSLAQGAVV